MISRQSQEIALSHIDRRFRLSHEAGGLGLRCNSDGLTLAGAPLLRKAAFGFEPRPADELAALMMSAYGDQIDPDDLAPGLDVIAKALNAGDLGRAMVAALRLKLPDVEPGAAERLAEAEAVLAKFNSAELRDWLGRWTTWGAAPPSKPALSQKPGPRVTNEDRVRALQTLLPRFEQEFDSLGPVEFSKKVWNFGYWLGQQANAGRSIDLAATQAEYLFLQNRLDFWIAYQHKSPRAHLNVLGAAQMLYEGAVIAGVTDSDHFPKSMVAVATNAMAYEGPNPAGFRSLRSFNSEPESFVPLAPALRGRLQGLGGAIDNSEIGITFGKGIFQQGQPWERFLTKIFGSRLHPNSKTFDHFVVTEEDGRGTAISDKVIDTSAYTYASDPRKIYSSMKGYIDDAADYTRRETRRNIDLNPVDIAKKQIQLAVPDDASPQQRMQVLRSVQYGASRNVSVEVTWVK